MKTVTPLKRAIFESQVVQRDLATEVGIDPAQLSRIVNGLRCNEATQVAIAKALGRDVADLFAVHGDEPTAPSTPGDLRRNDDEKAAA